MWKTREVCFAPGLLVAVLLACASAQAVGGLVLGPEGLVQAGGLNISVPGHSVPSFAFWDGDTLKDLIVGDGGEAFPTGKVRVYLNVGSESNPQFTNFFYAQSDGSDLICPSCGCQGCAPLVVYWDADARKDLLVGLSDGTVKIFLNIGTEENPQFDGGTLLQVGEPGSKIDINVIERSTPAVMDWNNDGRKDLVVGADDGMIHLFLNEGTDSSPDFRSEQFVQEDSTNLLVPTGLPSPDVLDLDDDGKKDLLTGDSEGQVLLYSNAGSDSAPVFSGYVPVEAAGVPINPPGLFRSRPQICDWTGDGFLDLVIGSIDGLVHLYQGVDPTGVVAGEEQPPATTTARLHAAYPNPFNPRATIPFELSEPGRVRLCVYDRSGRYIGLLADRVFAEGPHQVTWLGLDDRGRPLPSGVYFVRMDADGISGARKLVLLR